MAVLGINHVTLRVQNLERARAFYELLGFHQTGQREGMLFFAVGDHHHHVALMEVGEEAPKPGRGTTGMAHFAVTVDGEAELGRLHRLVTEAGYTVVHITDHRTNRSFYVKDADSNVVEVTWDAPRPEWATLDNPFDEDRPYQIPPGDS